MGNARVTWTTTFFFFFFFSILVPRSSRAVDRHWRCSSASPLLPSFDRVILHYLSLPISSRFESRGSRTGGDSASKIYPLAFLLLILVQWPSFLILAKREREKHDIVEERYTIFVKFWEATMKRNEDSHFCDLLFNSIYIFLNERELSEVRNFNNNYLKLTPPKREKKLNPESLQVNYAARSRTREVSTRTKGRKKSRNAILPASRAQITHLLSNPR